ncbi:putative HTH-type transcriptional regulator R00410 [Aureimonas endophytica]|uniref:HTH-type transcriptional regulator R00410 n=1 Tax=Aureimonas endophytica TaxID=2027858 RepID=A0A917A106_9HYPH|nr:helix-turn-helix domain-containing protein [Aureimonas endophytica]GGE21924.1 putative HTH-type transcriptional regulator R00410 [Aureimonas endophytica]
MSDNKKKPNPVDIHVGSRVRLRRTMLGMSQERLGESLGITFQQIQKYEKGSNRIGASRLQKMGEVLSVPIAFFFEDAPNGAATPDGFQEGQGPNYVVDFLSTAEGLQLSRAFMKIADPKVRRRIIDLVRTLGEASEDEGGSGRS